MHKAQLVSGWTRSLDPFANVHVVYRYFSAILAHWKDIIFRLSSIARVCTSPCIILLRGLNHGPTFPASFREGTSFAGSMLIPFWSHIVTRFIPDLILYLSCESSFPLLRITRDGSHPNRLLHQERTPTSTCSLLDVVQSLQYCC